MTEPSCFFLCSHLEHEACIRDICELKWHLRQKKETLDQVKDKVAHTQVLHRRLNEDIDFVKKHGPLVKEKLELEDDFMSKIKAAQVEVLCLMVSTVRDHQINVPHKSNRTHVFTLEESTI